MQWYAVQVTTAHEKKVKKYLEKQRASGLNIGEIAIPEKDGAPIIPGYVFVQADTWPEFYLIGCNSRCRVIGKVLDAEMNRLLSINNNGSKPGPVFKKGDEVIICSGPLEGVEGIIVRAGARRSKVSFFNGEVIINADNDQLVPAEKGLQQAGSCNA
jgi:transcriptional antiterminator NusG